jgi:predicted permease
MSIQVLRHAARRLLRAPTFTVATILTLMLGIGAVAAVFTVVNGVLLRPLPFADAGQLVDLSHTLTISGITRVNQSDATYLYYREANRTFEAVGAYRAVTASLAPDQEAAVDDSRAERLDAARVSASLFHVLGAQPLRGRTFTEDEDRPDAARVVLIGQGLWERKYGGDPRIVGRGIRVDGVEREVVGVMPAGFRFPKPRTELWLPIGIDPARTRSAAFDYRAVGRLRDGVTVETARADLQRLLPQVPVAFPGRLTAPAIEQTRMQAVVRPLRDVVIGDTGRMLWVVLGAVGFVLLIACANVANLFLVRGEARHHELAIRRALGGGRGSIMAAFIAEGVLVAAVGGALGVMLAAAGVGFLRGMVGVIPLPRLAELQVDAATLGVAAGTTILAALLVSALPALRMSGAAITAALSDGSHTATSGPVRHRARHALVIVQLALALILLAGAGLMARSFAQLRAVEPGFDAANVLVFRAALPEASYDADAAAGFVMRALDALGSLPGVERTAAISKLPLDAMARQDTALFVEDRPLEPGDLPSIHQVSFVTPGYFRALGIPLLAGRDIDAPDPARTVHDLVVSASLAARYWTDPTMAIGRRVRMSPLGPWFTIVGVAGDVRGTTLEAPPDEMLYLPVLTVPGTADVASTAGTRWAPRDVAYVLRTTLEPSTLLASATRTLGRLDSAVPVYASRTMGEVVAHASASTSFSMILLGIASVAALALGAVGIHGVIAYGVTLREREFAVRLALGARPVDVRRLVSRQAVTSIVLGMTIGIAGAVALTRFMSALLYGVRPVDPITLGAAAALLFVVALGSSWSSARRAAAQDPARALRAA